MSIHINHGHARRESDPEDLCLYCDKHFAQMAYTYFGAPVCGVCWDGQWRSTEDGRTDPPFGRIENEHQCEWLA